MPTLLSPPSRNLAEDTSSEDLSAAKRNDLGLPATHGETQPRPSSPRRVSPRRLAGVICLALALLLSVFVGGPSIALAYDLGTAARAGANIVLSNLIQHVFVPSVDTASTGFAPEIGQDSCVPGNRNAWGQSLLIDSTAWICGNVTVYGGSVMVQGRVNGDVRAIGGDIEISGQVGGNVTSIGGNVHLQPGAQVGGNIQALLGGSVNREPNVLVRGNVTTDEDLRNFGPGNSPVTSLYLPWVQLLFWALAGAALALLAPERVMRVRAMAEKQLAKSMASGLLALVLGLVGTLVLMLTLIGIPLAVLLVAALWLAWVVGTVALGSWLGETLLGPLARRRLSPVVTTVPGVCLIAALTALPYVGWGVFFITGIGGMGASLRTFLATRMARRARRQTAKV